MKAIFLFLSLLIILVGCGHYRPVAIALPPGAGTLTTAEPQQATVARPQQAVVVTDPRPRPSQDSWYPDPTLVYFVNTTEVVKMKLWVNPKNFSEQPTWIFEPGLEWPVRVPVGDNNICVEGKTKASVPVGRKCFPLHISPYARGGYVQRISLGEGLFPRQ